MPALRLLDTCGSGDWCTAGLIAKAGRNGLASLRAGGAKGLEAGLRYGQTLAAWNCGFEGARGGMYALDASILDEQMTALLAGKTEIPAAARPDRAAKAIACPACPPRRSKTLTAASRKAA